MMATTTMSSNKVKPERSDLLKLLTHANSYVLYSRTQSIIALNNFSYIERKRW